MSWFISKCQEAKGTQKMDGQDLRWVDISEDIMGHFLGQEDILKTFLRASLDTAHP